MSKYRAVRTNGYASKKEAQVAADLQLLQRAGKIKNLREQVSFDLLLDAPGLGYKLPLRYVADFVFDEDTSGDGFEAHWTRVVADAKGFKTPLYKIKKRLMLQLLGIEIREI